MPEGLGRQIGADDKFIEMIERDILDRKLGVKWEDIAQLEDAKRLLQEAVVLPLLMPDIYTGIREPWKGVLLFGPPGTGKTLLAKAVASQAQTTFFNVGPSTIISKYHGESEKLVRALFSLARYLAPSTIFFDEIDSVMSARGTQAEHEASRRVKGEMLQQMDGVTGTETEGEQKQLVMVLATSNKPWDLDEALLRRLEKRVYVPLPTQAGRAALFKLFLKGVELGGDVNLDDIARRTEGYSGADLHILCRDACMAPMRRLNAKHTPQEIMELKANGRLDLGVSARDLEGAVKSTAPSVAPATLQDYVKWNKDFAST